MKCPRCGKLNSDNSTVCSQCGTQLVQGKTTQPLQRTGEMQNMQRTNVSQSSSPGSNPGQNTKNYTQKQNIPTQQKTTTQGRVSSTVGANNPQIHSAYNQPQRQAQQNPAPNPNQRRPQQQTQTQGQVQTQGQTPAPPPPQPTTQQPQQIPQPPPGPSQVMMQNLGHATMQPGFQQRQIQPQIPQMPVQQPGLMPTSGPLQQQIVKPTSGVCSVCNQNNLVFFDNGMGKCLYCGRIFDWLNPKLKRLEERKRKLQNEKNPFMITEDEVPDKSERKAEVEADEVIYHETHSGIIGGRSKDKEKEKKRKGETDLTNEKRMELLEDRLLSGEISEETYKKLHDKFSAKILESLEDKLVMGEISEDKYNELKQKYM